jgi:hypothetical protein
MEFLQNERLYSHTEECLQFLREMESISDRSAPKQPERYHTYWYGPFSLKQAFSIKSFLATQDLKKSELWLWLDAENGYAGYMDNPFLRPFLSFLQVKRFDPEVEARGTPLEQRPDLYRGANPTQRSNFFRFTVLYKYGGIYTDMDVMFLRDFSASYHNGSFHNEFCYRWSSHISYANSAVLRLKQQSETARALLVRCCEVGSCRPKHVLRFEDNVNLDITVLPCPYFDPLWPHHDRQDNYKTAPYRRFGDFFRKFSWRFGRNPAIRSYRDFFPGAFAYHWHNFWDAGEHEDSYFGLFNREFDLILGEKLGIDLPTQLVRNTLEEATKK